MQKTIFSIHGIKNHLLNNVLCREAAILRELRKFFRKISFPAFINDFGPAIPKITACGKRSYRLQYFNHLDAGPCEFEDIKSEQEEVLNGAL